MQKLLDSCQEAAVYRYQWPGNQPMKGLRDYRCLPVMFCVMKALEVCLSYNQCKLCSNIYPTITFPMFLSGIDLLSTAITGPGL